MPQGRLTLAFGNVEAFGRWNPQDPDRSRFVDEDFNRVWADDTLRGPRDSAELRRARQLAPIVDSADFLLDLHSMSEPCRPIMVCGATGKGGDKSARLSCELGAPQDLLIDTGDVIVHLFRPEVREFYQLEKMWLPADARAN